MLALATDYNGESRNTEKIRRTLSSIAGAGFSHIHWCHEWRGGYLYSVWEMRQIREWLDILGLRVKGVHASCGEIRFQYAATRDFEEERENLKDYVSQNEYNRLAGVELIKNRIDLARELETGEIVLHLPLPFRIFENDVSFKEKFYTAAFRSFDELKCYCLEKQVRICVENLYDCPENFQKEMFDRLFARYESNYMGICFDTGHGNIGSHDCLHFARCYTERLFIAHIHDNHGTGDEHLIPFEGSFNWEGFAEIVAKSPCESPCLLELNMHGKTEKVFFRKALDAGRKLQAMAERAGRLIFAGFNADCDITAATLSSSS
ncbi:MAG: sugar phosphate isomerase/epimerase [Treponema sp.]|jgi:sugar phosphate isomerase/epimerase|nr:sugar phosphate isomerase/epimerase [Treponema sp.]